MQKTRLSLFAIVLACVALFASSAFAEIDKGKLVGTWSGTVTSHYHGQQKSVDVELTFKQNGTFSLAVDGKAGRKVDEGSYTVKGESIVLGEDGKSQKVTLTRITLSKDAFSGDFVPDAAKENPSNDVYFTFAMKRGKGNAK